MSPRALAITVAVVVGIALGTAALTRAVLAPPPDAEAVPSGREASAHALGASRPRGSTEARVARLAGEVRRGGRPVGSAAITLWRERAERGGAATVGALEATSGVDGRFAFDRLPEGIYFAAAREGGDASPARGPFAVFGGGASVEVLLELEATVTLEGVVVDLVRRAPVREALVRSPQGTSRTDAAGRFVLRGARGPAWLEVTAPGYLARREWLGLEQARDGGRLELVLSPVARITGVIREAGAPASGATVWAELLSGARRGERTAIATSDAEGRFRLECSDGLLHLAAATAAGVRLAGKELRLGIGEEREVELEIGEATPAEGLVVRDGAPLPGAEVAVVDAPTDRVAFTTRTDAAGAFRTPPLAAGRYLARVQAGAFAGVGGPFRHGVEGGPWRVELSGGGALRGQIDPPSAGVRVRWRGGGWAGPSAETLTDAAGRFAFEGVPDGTVALDAEGEAGAGTAVARRGDDVRLRLSRSVVLVEIVDDRGERVADASVLARSLETGAIRRQLALAPDGQFQLELPHGPWEISAEASGRGRTSGVPVNAGVPGAAVRLTLPAAMVLWGSVLDARTRLPVTGALVLAHERGALERRRSAAVTDARGAFTLPAVSRTAALLVSREGYVPTWRNAADADGAGRLEVSLERGSGRHPAADDTSWRFEGVGMTLTEQAGRITVAAVHEDSPAERAGVLPGDVILAVDGTVVGPPLERAVARIRGASGTAVHISFQRAGRGLEVVLRRRLLTL